MSERREIARFWAAHGAFAALVRALGAWRRTGTAFARLVSAPATLRLNAHIPSQLALAPVRLRKRAP